MEDKIPDILYHYCSVDTLVNILQNRSLRISEIAKSNDSMECKWLEKNILPKKIRECVEQNSRLKDSDQAIKNDIVLKCLDRYFNYYGDNIDIQAARLVLAMCFSQEGDLLSQWRGYAADGLGVSVGFTKELFEKIVEVNRFIHIRKVLYSEKDQMNCFDKEIREYVEEVILNKNVSSYASLISLLAPIAEDAIAMKNPAFGEEKEWRLFTFFKKVENLNDLNGDFERMGLNNLMSKLGYSVRSNKLVYYRDLLLDAVHGKDQLIDYVAEIILGPKCKLSERDDNLLLGSNGWDTSRIKISKSTATYV